MTSFWLALLHTGVLACVVHSWHPSGLLWASSLLQAVVDEGLERILQVWLENISIYWIVEGQLGSLGHGRVREDWDGGGSVRNHRPEGKFQKLILPRRNLEFQVLTICHQYFIQSNSTEVTASIGSNSEYWFVKLISSGNIHCSIP